MYACTSGSIVIGEHAVAQQIRLGAPKSQPMTLVTGVVDALRALNVKNIVVATPYIEWVNKLEYRFLTLRTRIKRRVLDSEFYTEN